jgi:hypothetical protein
MSWREREAQIDNALSTLRATQQEPLKGNRAHQQAMVDRTARIIALESGRCRTCNKLVIDETRAAGRPAVSLICRSNLSPLDLHRDTVYSFTIPDCELYQPLVGIEDEAFSEAPRLVFAK